MHIDYLLETITSHRVTSGHDPLPHSSTLVGIDEMQPTSSAGIVSSWGRAKGCRGLFLHGCMVDRRFRSSQATKFVIVHAVRCIEDVNGNWLRPRERYLVSRRLSVGYVALRIDMCRTEKKWLRCLQLANPGRWYTLAYQTGTGGRYQAYGLMTGPLQPDVPAYGMEPDSGVIVDQEIHDRPRWW